LRFSANTGEKHSAIVPIIRRAGGTKAVDRTWCRYFLAIFSR
jgi:hypothetical protein